MIDIILTGLIFGCWGWLFGCVLTRDGEMFQWLPKVVRYMLTGSGKVRLYDDWSAAWVVNKMFFCPKCHAGWLLIINSIYLYYKTNCFELNILLIHIVSAMTVATILERKIL